VRPNDGVHCHALLAIPPQSRLGVPLDVHVPRNSGLYYGPEKRIAEIDVQRIDAPKGRIVDYTFKHVKRGTFATDDILILPKSLTEIL
jgi:hypothetical protein